MKDSNYQSVQVKKTTYKELKLLAIELEIPFTRLIDKLLEDYKMSLPAVRSGEKKSSE